MLRIVPDHFMTERMCKNVVKKLSFVIRNVPDQYNTIEMCDKVIIKNSGMLVFIPHCYKNKNVQHSFL